MWIILASFFASPALAQGLTSTPILHPATGRCLDPDLVDGAAGRQVRLGACDPGPDQAWAFTEEGLRNAAQGLCVGLDGALGACSSAVMRDPVGDQTFRVRVADGRCLQVEGPKSKPRLALATCADGAAQLFRQGAATPMAAVFSQPGYAGERRVITDSLADVVATLGVAAVGVQMANAHVTTFNQTGLSGRCRPVHGAHPDLASAGFDIRSVGLGACPAPAVTESPLATRVTLYQHENYGGTAQEFAADTPGSDALLTSGVSSLKVTGGPVALYTGPNFTGDCRTYTGDASQVGLELNDRFRSLKVDAACAGVTLVQAWQHAIDRGTSAWLTADAASLPTGIDGELSGLRLWGGPISLYIAPNFGGDCVTITGDVADMAGWNDLPRSIRFGACR